MDNDNKQLGHVNKFMVANGLSELKENLNDLSPYSGFEGELDSDFNGDEFSELAGIRRKKRPTRKNPPPRYASKPKLKRAGKIMQKAFGYTPLGAGIKLGKKLTSDEAIARRQKNKEMRFKNKASEQAFQQKIIDKSGDTDVLLEQLSKAPITPVKEPMKTSTKIIIGVSVVAVLGTVAFILYKKYKK
jgi:hypothetical protein